MLMAVPWIKPGRDDDIRCGATVFVGDDRWGGWTNRCQLRKGHGGYHRHPLDACEPKAFMAWTGVHSDGDDDSSGCTHPPDGVMWNEFNKVTQCHRCGTRIDGSP